jgi:hypothetical protein
MAGPAGVLVIHGSRSESIAIRLAMDLCSDGIPAHPTALEKLVPSDWREGLPAVTGLVIIYDGQTWITKDVEASLCAMHPMRPVVFARSQGSRFNPDFLRFHVVPLFEGLTFSYYQPHGKSRTGYARVVDFLGGPMPVRDSRKRGFAFLSYSSKDRRFVDEHLVPALAGCNIGFFDYRFTERLDERRLEHEIERRIKQCAFIIAHRSANWDKSKFTDLEARLAQEHGKPIVAVSQLGEAVSRQLTRTACAFTSARDWNSKELLKAIEGALAGTRALKLLRPAHERQTISLEPLSPRLVRTDILRGRNSGGA